MINRKLIIMVLLCLIVSPATAMKRAGLIIEREGSFCKRPRLGDIEKLDMRTDAPFKSILDGIDKPEKPNVFDALDDNDFYAFSSLAVTGTDPNKIDYEDGNPLSMKLWLSDCTTEQKKEGYRLLKARGVDVNAATANTGTTLLHFAAMANDVPFITEIVQDGGDIHAEDCDGDTPIFYATKPQTINELARHGADINHQNDKGQTLLFSLAGDQQSDSAKMAILWGVYPEITDDKGRTAYVKHEQKFENAHPVLKENETVRKDIIMPALAIATKNNPVSFVHNRAITGKTMSHQQLAARNM